MTGGWSCINFDLKTDFDHIKPKILNNELEDTKELPINTYVNIVVKSNKNMRLNLIYVILLFIHLWTPSVNIKDVCGFWSFYWIWILLWGCVRERLYCSLLGGVHMSSCCLMCIQHSQPPVYISVTATDILWWGNLYLVAMRSPSRPNTPGSFADQVWQCKVYFGISKNEPSIFWIHPRSTSFRTNVTYQH